MGVKTVNTFVCATVYMYVGAAAECYRQSKGHNETASDLVKNTLNTA